MREFRLLAGEQLRLGGWGRPCHSHTPAVIQIHCLQVAIFVGRRQSALHTPAALRMPAWAGKNIGWLCTSTPSHHHWITQKIPTVMLQRNCIQCGNGLGPQSHLCGRTQEYIKMRKKNALLASSPNKASLGDENMEDTGVGQLKFLK